MSSRAAPSAAALLRRLAANALRRAGDDDDFIGKTHFASLCRRALAGDKFLYTRTPPG